MERCKGCQLSQVLFARLRSTKQTGHYGSYIILHGISVTLSVDDTATPLSTTWRTTFGRGSSSLTTTYLPTGTDEA